METKNLRPILPKNLNLYIETYGCMMNVGDSEVVVSIMKNEGYNYTEEIDQADIILINTCSIRENAEGRIWGRLKELRSQKRRKKGLIVGVIGCMAERLKEKLLEQEQCVNLVIGPDAYRSLPRLVEEARAGSKGVDTKLCQEETYQDISPVRLDKSGVSAYVSIMRGCNNMCSYCVVPYTRGAERSRSSKTIRKEVAEIVSQGYKEISLLGQNVNSYNYEGENINFAQLMAMVAEQNPTIRIRFSTSHPKDLSDELLQVMAKYDNICKSVHLPAQSGSTTMLERMNRKYTREWYLERIAAIRRYMPECSISTDIIAGFSGETEQEHQQTLSIMEEVGYEFAYMYKYSEREGTKASRTMPDNISEELKSKRLTEIIALQGKLSLKSNQKDISKTFEVLVEGISKKNKEELHGRTSQNKVVIFPKQNLQPGDYTQVTITHCTQATLFGK